ncbi:MAG TPA: efflux RND transporter periplasmic adaptor subunit, partial [Pseudomonadota bacterium]|nr:efflux RND transporter periplasmic adaptor subunit [Pseudomonadota bacterium]
QVPQSDVAAIREHRQAAVILDAASGERLEAKEVVVYPNADPQTHSFRVRLELPAQETGLHPGMTVKVAFTVGEAQRLLVPAAALLQRSEVTAVYVLDAQGPTLRQVRIGHRYGDRVEVLAGLDDGERIALDPVATGEWLAKSRRGAGGHG